MTDRPCGRLGRRAFLSTVGAAPLAAGLLPGVASAATRRFAPQEGAADAAVFAEARRHFLIPEGVAYCNTGTLGASPREVVDALVKGIRAPRERAGGLAVRAGGRRAADGLSAAGRSARRRSAGWSRRRPSEIALIQNATMGMNFLGHGLDLASGDEVVTTDQEHSGGISVWRLLAKRRGIVLKELPLDPALRRRPRRGRPPLRRCPHTENARGHVQPHHLGARRQAARRASCARWRATAARSRWWTARRPSGRSRWTCRRWAATPTSRARTSG